VAYNSDAASTEAGEPDKPDAAERADKLLRMLKAEENDALGYRQSELQQQQIDALKHYYGELYGDEEEGRSKVVTREVFETIEWTRPDLMRVFASGDKIVFLEETNQEDEKYAEDAADYISWIFFSDNPGYELLDDFAFDGLLHRRGFMACYWRDHEYRAPEKLTGQTQQQVQQLMADPAVQIVSYDNARSHAKSSEVDGFDLTIRKRKSVARAEVVTIAPEDMRLNGRAVHIDDARYVGRVMRMFRGEVARLWPEKAAEIMEYSGSAVSGPQNVRRGSDVRMERFRDNSDDWQATGNDAAQEIEVLEEYLRVDLDEDGYPEMICSYRMGDLLLEEYEVEENPFASWTPIRVPHRFYGLSQHDITYDLQRQSTVLNRAVLDATYQSVVNREAYNKNTVNLDSLLATYSGAKVEVDGNPGDQILPLTGGLDTAKSALSTIELLTQRLEDRTGATRQTQGADPDALAKGPHSGKAIDLLQTAGAGRKEIMARNMAVGLEQFFGKLYRLVCRNQNQPRQAKVGGKWAQFDPRTWNGDLKVSIHCGLGTGNRDQEIMGLQAIGAQQQAFVTQYGMDNPVINAGHLYHTFDKLCRALGYRSAAGYADEPPQVPVQGPDGQPQIDPQTGQPQTKPWAPPPPQDPQAVKAASDQQIAQQQAQVETLKVQQASQDSQLQLQQTAEMAASQHSHDLIKLQADHEKNMAELALKHAQLAHEGGKLDFEREKAALEAQIKAEELRIKEKDIDSRTALDSAKIQHDGEHKDKDREASKETTKMTLAAKKAEAKKPAAKA
jgi:hypothetical protein